MDSKLPQLLAWDKYRRDKWS